MDPVRTGRGANSPPHAVPDQKHDDSDHGENQQKPPSRSIKIMQASDRDREPRKEQSEIDEGLDWSEGRRREQRQINQLSRKRGERCKERPVPELRPRRAPGKIHVIVESGGNCLSKIHLPPPLSCVPR